jgi:hypothetical protein
MALTAGPAVAGLRLGAIDPARSQQLGERASGAFARPYQQVKEETWVAMRSAEF